MEIHQIRYFLALSDTLNFTKAAEICNVSQPALTRAIQKLEDELGGALVVRERAKTHLTELGRIMEPRLKKILNNMQSAKAAAKAFHGEEQASVRVALSQTVDASLIAQSLQELTRVVSSLEITLCRDMGVSLIERLEDGSVDLVIAGDLQKHWNRLESWPLFEEGFCLLVPAQDELTKNTDILVDALSELTLMPRIYCEDTQRITQSLPSDVSPSQTPHFTSTEADLAAFVEFGLGYAIVPNSAKVSEMLAKIPVQGDGFYRSVNVYGAAGRQRSPACATLIKLLRTIDWTMTDLVQPVA